MRIRALFQQRLFTLWFGLGLPPLLAGALGLAFAEAWWLGAAASGVFAAWFYESGRTTCSRLAYYGTAKCGLPGLIAPLFTQKQSPASLSPERIRSHRIVDLWVLVLLNGLYALQPWWLAAPLIWSVGVWCISLGPKRHHGLLYRLRERPPTDVGTRRSITIVRNAPAHSGDARPDRYTDSTVRT